MLTIAAVAARKGITLQWIDVQVERQTVEDPTWQTAFVIRLDLGQGLTPRERAIFMGAARHCEVHKLLVGEMRFDYGWAEAADRQE